jgi:hypothetical protein
MEWFQTIVRAGYVRNLAVLIASALSPFIVYFLKRYVYDPLEARLPTALWRILKCLFVDVPRLLFIPFKIVAGFVWSTFIYSSLCLLVFHFLPDLLTAALTKYDEIYGLHNSYVVQALLQFIEISTKSALAERATSVVQSVHLASLSVVTFPARLPGLWWQLINETFSPLINT